MVRKIFWFIALILVIATQGVFAEIKFSNEGKSFVIETSGGKCSYSFEDGEDSLEMVCNNLSNEQEERVKCPGETAIELRVAPGIKRAFALVELETGARKLVAFDLQPLRVLNVIDVTAATCRIFPVDSRYAAVLDYGVKDAKQTQNIFQFVVNKKNHGQLQYIDVEQAEVVQAYEFNPKWTYWIEWNSKHNVLTMQGSNSYHGYNGSRGVFEFNSKSVLGRISGSGMRVFNLSTLVWDSQYDPQKDLIYGLTSNKLEVLNCVTGEKQTVYIGPTSYDLIVSVLEKEMHFNMPYKLNLYSKRNQLIKYNVWNGRVIIIDTNSLRVIKKLKAGRIRVSVQEHIEDSRTIVAAGKDFSRIYTLDQGANKIRIFDESLKEVGVLTVPSKSLAMYAAGDPIVVTESGIYKIEDDTLKEIHQLVPSVKTVLGHQLGTILFLKTDDQSLLLNNETGTVIMDL